MRPVVVHTLEQAHAALEAAAELKQSIVLQSAPDAIFYAGGLYLFHMFKQARAACPKAKAIFILDCADAGAEAIAAMQTGHTHIRSSAAPELRKKLADIAAQHGVTLYTGNDEALDLAKVRDTKNACKHWLSEDV